MPDVHSILVIDDEEVILSASRRILELEGFTVRTAADAESGLQMMAAATPEIVVVDLKLPGISGLEFLERSISLYPESLVILTTGFATATQAVSALAGAAFDYLPKPFAFQELLSPIRRACNFLGLCDADRIPVPDDGKSRFLCLGNMSWARPESENTFSVGPTQAFGNSVGPLREIAFPSTNEDVQQGGPLAKFSSAEGFIHILWAPLGGRVLSVNTDLQANPKKVSESNLTENWIARISHADAGSELNVLRRS